MKRVNKQNEHIIVCRVHYAVSDTTPAHSVVGSVLLGLSVVYSCRETPGPIPNPEAKPAHADGTATGRLWESKSPPTPNNNNTTKYNKEEDGIPPPSSFIVLLVSNAWTKGRFLHQIWDLTESLKEFLADLKECQK